MRKLNSKGMIWLNTIDNSVLLPGQEILVEGKYLKGNGTFVDASSRQRKNNVTVVSEIPAPQDRSSSRNRSIDWKLKYNDFISQLTLELKDYLTQQGVDYNYVLKMLLFLLSRGYNLGRWGADERWGSTSQTAWDAFKSTIPTVTQPEPIKPVEASILPTQPVQPTTPNYGYKTNFDYTGSNNAIRRFGFNNYSG